MKTTSKARQKRAGLIIPIETANSIGLKAGDGIALTQHRQRAYKPRARKCKCCKQVFTPKSASGKYCSAACRSKVWRRRHPHKPTTKEPVLTAITCQHCGKGYLVDSPRRLYCSATCRTLAWKTRRAAAVQALSESVGMSAHKTGDVMETGGLKAVTTILHSLGMVYDAGARRWLVPMQESIFVQHQN